MSTTGDLLRRVCEEIEGLFHSWNSISIEESGESELTLSHGRRLIVVNSRFGTVKSGTSVLTRFDELKSIDITHHRRIRNRPEYWSICFNLNWYSSVPIGRTLDKTEGSIVGAQLSRYTKKIVRSL